MQTTTAEEDDAIEEMPTRTPIVWDATGFGWKPAEAAAQPPQPPSDNQPVEEPPVVVNVNNNEPPKRRRVGLYELRTLTDRLLEDPDSQENTSLYNRIVAAAQPLNKPPVQDIDLDARARGYAEGDARFARFEVWVNTNERNYQTLLQELRKRSVPCRGVSGATLVVGDFWIVHNGRYVVSVLERKSVEDLRGSILDGRYADQPTRIIKSNAPLQFILVTGSMYWIKDLEERKSVQSAIIHLQHAHDRLRVEQFTEDSLMPDVLAAHCKYAGMYADGAEWTTSLPEVEQVKRECAKRKIDNQDDAWFVQMCVVDGMSPKRAEVVKERYHSASHYLEAIRERTTERDRELMIADLKVPVKNGFRRVGDVLSKRFYQSMVPHARTTDSETHVVRLAAAATKPATSRKRVVP